MSAQPVLDAALDSLAHLICSDRERSGEAPVHRLAATEFDGCEPLIGEDIQFLLGDHPGDQPVWPVDVATAQPANEDWPAGSWQFTRWSTLKPTEWRGKIHRVHPRMLDFRCMVSQPSGVNLGVRLPYAILGQKVVEASRCNTGMGYGSDPRSVFGVNPVWFGSGKANGATDWNKTQEIRMLGGLALRRRYHWSVMLGEDKGPRVRFLTDVIGMREVFRLRDIPEGAKRRAALLHWVRAHWRKKRDPGSDDKAWIRRHLRGAWSFTWDSLICCIEPSEYDLEQLALETNSSKL